MLPSGCKRVEYIESTGSQYIDTEFKPNQNTRVIIDYQITNAQTIPLFGARNGSTNREFEMFAYADDRGMQDGYGSSQDYVTSSPNLNRTTIDKNKNVTTSSDGSVNKTHAAQTFQCSYNMYLFQMNNGGQIYNASYGSRCYSCQIYDNGTLIRDYIPYIDENGDANLWDDVNEATAKKVGTFIAGPEVATGKPVGFVQLQYIVSDGSQYIDTEFKPNQNTRLVMDFYNTGDYSGMTTGLCPLLGARNGSSSAVFAMWIGNTSYPHYGNVAYNKNGGFTTDIDRRLIYDFNKNIATIGSDSIACASATFSTSYNLCLLTINNYGTIEGRRASGRLYSCQIYDNGTLVRDYIPYSDESGAVGMWDNVSDQPASKFGTFIAGPEAVPQLPQLITDRTQNDVEKAKRIRANLASGEALTDAELAAYFAGLRGCYNASDMNRVGNAVRYIAYRLNAERYGVVVYPRTRWTMEDIVRKSDWKAYLDEVQKLRYVLTLLPTTPEITDAMYDGIGYTEANHIEQILVDLDTLITRMIAGFYYSGELFAGEV